MYHARKMQKKTIMQFLKYFLKTKPMSNTDILCSLYFYLGLSVTILCSIEIESFVCRCVDNDVLKTIQNIDELKT